MPYTRYAIYYVPPPGRFARFGADWFGWDIASGKAVPQVDVPGIAAITARPARYGFHATLKPPFRLAGGADLDQLRDAVVALGRDLAPAACDGLQVARLGRFLALTLVGESPGLSSVAARCVSELDRFRAAMTEEELVARRVRRLSDRQDALLVRWGYPYVMEEYRFHMTLTDRLPKGEIAHWENTLINLLPELPKPFVVDQVALVGERADGRFEVIEQVPLLG